MQGLASFIMRGRMQAVMVVAVTAMLSLVFPPLGYIGSAAIALVTLRRGPAEGISVLLGAGLAVTALAMLSLGHAAVALAFAVIWLPVCILAVILRYTVSLALMLEMAIGIALLLIAVMHGLLDDPVAYWQQMLREVLIPAMGGSNALLEKPLSDEHLAQMATWMTGLVTVMLALGWIVSLLLARWWQARLWNPGGFGAEFQALRLHRGMGPLILALIAAQSMGLGGAGSWVTEVLLLLLLACLFQGLAVMHAVNAQLGQKRGWLIVIYVLLVLLPMKAIAVLGLLGFLDVWLDLRKRIPHL